jgi:hypothetical protein
MDRDQTLFEPLRFVPDWNGSGEFPGVSWRADRWKIIDEDPEG